PLTPTRLTMAPTRNQMDLRLRRTNKREFAIKKERFTAIVPCRHSLPSAPASLCAPSAPVRRPDWTDCIGEWADLSTAPATTVSSSSMESTVSIPSYFFGNAQSVTSSASSLFVDPSAESELDRDPIAKTTVSSSSMDSTVSIPDNFFEAAKPITSSASS
ncbi:hypothetical protein PFISCL1PPCAC_16439, partial [Pristionchus fissidentatus]